MRLTIGDGYTLPGETRETVTDPVTGRQLYTGLPVVAFKYRPPTHAELLAYRYAFNRADSGEQQAQEDFRFLTRHLTEWDVQLADGTPAPITAASLKEMGEPIVSQLINQCVTWGAKPQGDAEKN